MSVTLQQPSDLNVLQARKKLLLASVRLPLAPHLLALDWPSSLQEQLVQAGWQVPPAELNAQKREQLRSSLRSRRFQPAHRPIVAALATHPHDSNAVTTLLNSASPSIASLGSLNLVVLDGRHLLSVLLEEAETAARRVSELEEVEARSEEEEGELERLQEEGLSFLWVEVYGHEIFDTSSSSSAQLFHHHTTTPPQAPSAPSLPFPTLLRRLQHYDQNRRLQLGWRYDAPFVSDASWRLLRLRSVVTLAISALSASSTFADSFAYLVPSSLRYLFSGKTAISLPAIWIAVESTAQFFQHLVSAAARLPSPVTLDLHALLALNFSGSNPLSLPSLPSTDSEAKDQFRERGKKLAKELGWMAAIVEGQEDKSEVFRQRVEVKQWSPAVGMAAAGSRPVTTEGMWCGYQLRAVWQLLEKGDWCEGLGLQDVLQAPILLFPLDLASLYRLEKKQTPSFSCTIMQALTDYVLQPLDSLLAHLLPSALSNHPAIPSLGTEELLVGHFDSSRLTEGMLAFIKNTRGKWQQAASQSWLVDESIVERVRALTAKASAHHFPLQAAVLTVAFLLHTPPSRLPEPVQTLLLSLPAPAAAPPQRSSPQAPASSSSLSSPPAARPRTNGLPSFNPRCRRFTSLLLSFPSWNDLLTTHLPTASRPPPPSSEFTDAAASIASLLRGVKKALERRRRGNWAAAVVEVWEGWLDEVGEEEQQQEEEEEERARREREGTMGRDELDLQHDQQKENRPVVNTGTRGVSLSPSHSPLQRLSGNSASYAPRPSSSHPSSYSLSTSSTSSTPASRSTTASSDPSSTHDHPFSTNFSANLAARAAYSAAPTKGKEREVTLEGDGTGEPTGATSGGNKRPLEVSSDEEEDEEDVSLEDSPPSDADDTDAVIPDASSSDPRSLSGKKGQDGKGDKDKEKQKKKKKKQKKKVYRDDDEYDLPEVAKKAVPPPARAAVDDAVGMDGLWMPTASLLARQSVAWSAATSALVVLFADWLARQPSYTTTTDQNSFLPLSLLERLQYLAGRPNLVHLWIGHFLTDPEEGPPALNSALQFPLPSANITPVHASFVLSAFEQQLRCWLTKEEADWKAAPEVTRRWFSFCRRIAGAGTRGGYYGTDGRRMNRIMGWREVEDDLGKEVGGG